MISGTTLVDIEQSAANMYENLVEVPPEVCCWCMERSRSRCHHVMDQHQIREQILLHLANLPDELIYEMYVEITTSDLHMYEGRAIPEPWPSNGMVFSRDSSQETLDEIEDVPEKIRYIVATRIVCFVFTNQPDLLLLNSVRSQLVDRMPILN